MLAREAAMGRTVDPLGIALGQTSEKSEKLNSRQWVAEQPEQGRKHV